MTTRTDRPGRDLQPRWPDRLRQRWADRRRGGRLRRNLRRGAAAALILAAALLLLVPPGPTAGAPLVVLARDLPVGAVLADPDLRTTTAPDPPAGALADPAAAIGRTLAAAARRGEVLTDVRLVDPAGPQPGPGRVAVPVRPADATVTELLRPGMHVAVLAVAEDGTAATLVADAVVLLVPTAGDRRDQAPPVVLAVPADLADRLIGVALTGTVALRFT